jgi:hypothetical protein
LREPVDELVGLAHQGRKFCDVGGDLSESLVALELCGRDEFDGLCEGFVPFGEPVKALVDVGSVGVVHETVAHSSLHIASRPTCSAEPRRLLD